VVVVDEEEVAQVHAVAPPPPPLSRQNATESARRSSARQASANATRGAVSYPHFASVRHIYLEDSTKIGLQTLFGVLDKTADGVIDGADFGPQFGSRRTMALWERLRDEFDEDSSGSIDPVEFISGFKRLAMMQPLDQSAFTKVPLTNLELLEQLQNSANAIVRALCSQLFDTVKDADPQPQPVAPFWAEQPQMALLSVNGLYMVEKLQQYLQCLFTAFDRDQNGVLSAADFEIPASLQNPRATNQAQQKWAAIQGAFDLNQDGQVTPDEFLLKFKELALTQPLLGFNSMPRNHNECIKLLNISTNAALAKFAKEVYSLLKAK